MFYPVEKKTPFYSVIPKRYICLKKRLLFYRNLVKIQDIQFAKASAPKIDDTLNSYTQYIFFRINIPKVT